MQYTTAHGDTLERIERYLGFSGQIMESAPTKHGKLAAIISFENCDANWQSMRLASGSMGGYTIFDTAELARDTFQLLVDCG